MTRDLFAVFQGQLKSSVIKNVTYSSNGDLITRFAIELIDGSRLELFPGMTVPKDDDQDEGADPFVDAMVSK